MKFCTVLRLRAWRSGCSAMPTARRKRSAMCWQERRPACSLGMSTDHPRRASRHFFRLRCSVHRFSADVQHRFARRGSAAFASAALRGMDGGFYSYERCGMDDLDRGMVQQSVMGRSHAASCRAQRHAGGKRPAPGQTNRFFRTGGSIGFLRGSCACRRSIPYACSPVRPAMDAVACSAGFHAQGQSETAFCSGVGAYGGFL